MRDPDLIGSGLAGYLKPRYPAGSLNSAWCDLAWMCRIRIWIDRGPARYLVAWYPAGYHGSGMMVNADSRVNEFFIYWEHKNGKLFEYIYNGFSMISYNSVFEPSKITM